MPGTRGMCAKYVRTLDQTGPLPRAVLRCKGSHDGKKVLVLDERKPCANRYRVRYRVRYGAVFPDGRGPPAQTSSRDSLHGSAHSAWLGSRRGGFRSYGERCTERRLCVGKFHRRRESVRGSFAGTRWIPETPPQGWWGIPLQTRNVGIDTFRTVIGADSTPAPPRVRLNHPRPLHTAPDPYASAPALYGGGSRISAAPCSAIASCRNRWTPESPDAGRSGCTGWFICFSPRRLNPVLCLLYESLHLSRKGYLAA